MHLAAAASSSSSSSPKKKQQRVSDTACTRERYYWTVAKKLNYSTLLLKKSKNWICHECWRAIIQYHFLDHSLA
jgi:hypothetical protein